MWEKEKLLVTSNFSFSHSVFKRLVQQTRKNKVLFGKGLWKFHPHMIPFMQFQFVCMIVEIEFHTLVLMIKARIQQKWIRKKIQQQRNLSTYLTMQ